jgi:membrane fusion protein, multidrug efflux system
MRKLRNIIIPLILVLLVSCKKKNKEMAMKEKPPVMVDILIASLENFSTDIEVNGSVLSYEMVELRPEVSGRIISLNIPDGEKVQQGTVLVKINDADLQAQLEQQKIQLELATKTEQRYKQLLAVNGINQSDYDLALSQVNNYKANIKVLNAQIDKTVIKAPFSGQLGLRLVSPGAYVTPLTLISTLQQTDRVKIDFTIPEAYEDLVAIGNTVIIQTNGSENKRPARIIAIEPQINIATRNLKVRAVLNNGNITPGSFVKVILNKKANGIIVPTNAIIPDALSNQVVEVKNGRAVFVNVETGLRKSDFVEISKGVKPGDSIVINGVLFVRPNAKVKIRNVKTIGKK